MNPGSTSWTRCLLLSLVISAAAYAGEQESLQPAPPTDPELHSIFPLGTPPGSEVQIEILGRNLLESRSLWTDTEGITAEILAVESAQYRLKEGKQVGKVAGQRVRLQVSVDPAVVLGPHALRLITRKGVSNTAVFWINPNPMVLETDADHHSPERAQLLTIPAAVQGRIGQEGEQDHYVFEISEGRQLSFEVFEGLQRSPGDFIRNPGFRMELYGRQESWFDPRRVTKLGQTNTWVSNFNQFEHAADIQPRLTRTLARGTYQCRVSGEVGSSYQLQIGPPGDFHPLTRRQGFDKLWKSRWLERDFARPLTPDRLQSLGHRSASAKGLSSAPPATDLVTAARQHVESWPKAPVLAEEEPNNERSQAKPVDLPAILEGAIQSAGDVDSFSFRARSGQGLAFELETPRKVFPYFNPHLSVRDGEGRELFTNIYKRQFAQDMFYWTTAEAKTLFTIPEDGTYLLQVRDVTHRQGAPDFSYRLMIRPQVPHVGEVEVAEVVSILEREGNVEIDRINLAPGEVKKLTVFTAREEGLEDDILVAVENLPAGVAVYPGTEVDIYPEPPQDEGHKQRFRPVLQSSTLLLMAQPDAGVTDEPAWIRFIVRPLRPTRTSRYYKLSAERALTPIRQGVTGPSIPVLEIPMMVVAPLEQEDDGGHFARTHTE